MQNGITTVCDACMKPLDGIFGTAKVKKQHLVIKGVIYRKVFDPDKVAHYVYANTSDRADNTWMHFCNGECLDTFMDAKVYLKKEYHEERGLEPINYINPDEAPETAKEEPKPVPETPKEPHQFFKNFKY